MSHNYRTALQRATLQRATLREATNRRDARAIALPLHRDDAPRALTTIMAALTAAALALSLFAANFARAAEAVGEVTEVTGTVEVIRTSGSAKEKAKYKLPIYAGDEVATGGDGRVKIHLTDDSVLALSPGTRMRVDSHVVKTQEQARTSTISLLKGTVLTLVGKVFSGSGSNYEVKTPTAVAGVRGTYFAVTVRPVQPTAMLNEHDRGTRVAGTNMPALPALALDALAQQSGTNASNLATDILVIEGEVDASNKSTKEPIRLRSGMEMSLGITDIFVPPQPAPQGSIDAALDLARVQTADRGDTGLNFYGGSGLDENQLQAATDDVSAEDGPSRRVGAGSRSLRDGGAFANSQQNRASSFRNGDDPIQRTLDESLQSSGRFTDVRIQFEFPQDELRTR